MSAATPDPTTGSTVTEPGMFLRHLQAFRHPPFPEPLFEHKPPKNIMRFLDTHLDDNLTLKAICHLPALETELSALCSTLFPPASRLKYKDCLFFLSPKTFEKLEHRTAGTDVANLNSDGFGAIACQFTSTALLHPDLPTVHAVLTWDSSPLVPNQDYSPFCDDSRVLRVRDLSESARAKTQLPAETREKIDALHRACPVLAVGAFFSPGAGGRACLEAMDELMFLDATRTKAFPWAQNSVPESPMGSGYGTGCGYGYVPEPRAVRPPDGRDTYWTLPEVAAHTHTPPKSACGSDGVAEHFELNQVRQSSDRTPSMDYIQRLWASAVRLDTSVIVFDCGPFKRVGIRHRETQTLYLTPLIDVCGDAFLDVWAGLHLAVVHDALARSASAFSTPRDLNLKRKAEEVVDLEFELPPRGLRPTTRSVSKRMRKTSADRLKVKNTLAYFQQHDVLALFLAYSHYTSPTPEVLLAPGTSRRESTSTSTSTSTSPSCISLTLTLTLTSKLGRGATGQVYRASLPFPLLLPVAHTTFTFTGSGSGSGSGLVAKLATSKETMRALRHEYGIYEHLRKAEEPEVSGIPHAFGYYQDERPGRELGVLVMDDVGFPLGLRMGMDGDGDGDGERKAVRLLSHERDALRRTLRAIHAQGVLHRDLRSWNMMSNGNFNCESDDSDRMGTGAGAVSSTSTSTSIIDFDRATLSGSEADFAEEMERLEKFLAGGFIDEDPVIGSRVE